MYLPLYMYISHDRTGEGALYPKFAVGRERSESEREVWELRSDRESEARQELRLCPLQYARVGTQSHGRTKWNGMCPLTLPAHFFITGCLTLLEILEMYWNYFSSWKSSSGGNLQNLLEIFWLSLCLLLLWLTILVFQNVSVETSGFVFNCNCNC